MKSDSNQIGASADEMSKVQGPKSKVLGTKEMSKVLGTGIPREIPGGIPGEIPGAGGISLPELEAGWCAAVVGIEAPDADIERLMAMGVCVGRKVELVKAGDPLILRVLGCRIGVSARLARRVMVDPCTMPGCLPSSSLK